MGAVVALGPGCRDPESTGVGSPRDQSDSLRSATSISFKERASELGLDFVHFNGMSGRLFLDEITCGGGALLDYDDDGDLDAYLVQGRMLGPATIDQALVAPRHPLPLTDRLYRNDLEGGAPRFTDVTAEAGLAAGGPAEAAGYGCGVAAGDYDNDGRIDLLVLNLGANQLLRNEGPGADGRVTFRDVTAAASPGEGGLRAPRSSVAASFFDYDRDGWLDLFVANNVTFRHQDPPPCYDQTGAREYCGPGAYPFEHDQLLRNRGPGADGTVRFEEVTAAAGMTGSFGPALGVVTADFDADGWPDVYVANDGEPNFLWINRRDGSFTEEGLMAGAAVDAAGVAQASMGVDAGDVDGDGDLDLFMTHLIRETNTLYLNDGSGLFADRTRGSGLGPESIVYTSFGTGFVDYDNDGRLDLLIVNGSVTRLPELVRRGDPFPLHQPNQLFRNLGTVGGGVRFAEVTAEAGGAFALSEVSRGAAFGDVDNDGDVDVLVVNNAGPARLLVNQVGQARSWLGVRLVGGRPPRDQLGARAAVLAGGAPRLWRRVRTDGSYNSAHDPRVLFGLGEGPRVDGVRVVWPDGSVEEWTGVAAGRYTTLVQGTGTTLEPSTGRIEGP
ncbi:MAG TPA: CRTAC1 family protein [Thermoanaerobaculia bacterium]